jgi:hypothetical protein
MVRNSWCCPVANRSYDGCDQGRLDRGSLHIINLVTGVQHNAIYQQAGDGYIFLQAIIEMHAGKAKGRAVQTIWSRT